MGDIVEDGCIPGLPADLGILCLAKLPIDAVARSRAVSRTWSLALRMYPHWRLPQVLVCFCRGNENDSFMTWLFLSRSDLRSHVIPSPYLKGAQHDVIDIFTSSIQVISTGTTLLLVRARLRFGVAEGKECCSEQCITEGSGGDVSSLQGPGYLQGFDVWQMRWLNPREMPWSGMPVDRWQFATAYLGRHVYFAGGDNLAAATTAERLSMDSWTWETLPQMHKDRRFHPVGFAMGGRFFVFGGESLCMSSTLPQSGEFYDPTTKMWTLVPDVWPHELWWASGGPQSIAVVKDVAYAIDEKLLAVLKVDGLSSSLKWEVAGQLPWTELDDVARASSMQHLVSVGENELWAILNNRHHHWVVFACRPHLAQQGLHWERLPFLVSPSSQSILLRGIGITT